MGQDFTEDFEKSDARTVLVDNSRSPGYNQITIMEADAWRNGVEKMKNEMPELVDIREIILFIY